MLTVRQFRAEDADAVRDLFAHAQDDVAESYSHTAADREGFHEYIDGALNHDLAHVERSYLQRPGNNFWVAELDGQTVGCIGAYRRDDEEAEIRRLAVDRSARRRGVASKLLDQAEEFLPRRRLRPRHRLDRQPHDRRHRLPPASRLPRAGRPRLPPHQPDAVPVRTGIAIIKVRDLATRYSMRGVILCY